MYRSRPWNHPFKFFVILYSVTDFSLFTILEILHSTAGTQNVNASGAGVLDVGIFDKERFRFDLPR